MQLNLQDKQVHIVSNDSDVSALLESAFVAESAQPVEQLTGVDALDVLVCYVGDTTPEKPSLDLKAVMDELVTSTFSAAKSCVDALKKAGGAMVLICATAEPVARGSLEAMTREWAVELAPNGVRTNLLVTDGLPRHSVERSDRLANAVLFLASARSSHTTGQIIEVDSV